MRLTFFGSSIVSSYRNRAATYYRGLLRALSRQGHRIVFCEPDGRDRRRHRDLAGDPEYAKLRVYGDAAERDAILEEAFEASDWVIKCSGVGAWDRELERGVAERSGAGVRTAFWDVAAPVTLDRIRRDPSDPFREDIPRFDGIFTYGGGPPVVTRYRELGARACIPVYNALDPAEHRPADEASGYRWDVLFMGNRVPDREARVEEFFFRASELGPELRFALAGAGWAERPMPANVEVLGHVPTAEHNRVNASARFVLNVHRESMAANGWLPATRMFEAAGASACQITDPWHGLENFFEPDREILVARSAEEVVRYARELDDATVRRIGRAARRRALGSHTYTRRAALVADVLRRAAPGRG